MNDRTKPNLQYVDTNTEKLVNLLIKGYEDIAHRKLYPADPIRLFILWIADIMAQQRVLIDYSAKQNLPRFAEGQNLDELVEFLNDTIKRLPAQPARTKLKYTLSTTRETATIIPAGFRVTVDGEITFKTLKDLIINIGETAGEVEAVCLLDGKIGNNFTPGQIAQAVDIAPYMQGVSNITTSTGGAEAETDESLYSRYREALATYSTAGPEGAYRFYAKSASADVADVKAISTTPGIVEIRVLLKGGELPEEEILQKIEKILSADEIRPLTDKVEVKAPQKKEYRIDLTYFTLKEDIVGVAELEKAVEEAVKKYKEWQSEKMGRDINPSMLNKFLMEAGIKRVEIRQPEYTKVEDTAVASLTTKNIVNGGAENE